MPTRKAQGIARTAKEAKELGYKKVKVSVKVDRAKKFALLKHGGSHIVCYYNPKTGNYDDCHEVAD